MTYKILKTGVRDSVFGVGCVICDFRVVLTW